MAAAVFVIVARAPKYIAYLTICVGLVLMIFGFMQIEMGHVDLVRAIFIDKRSRACGVGLTIIIASLVALFVVSSRRGR
jgi:hypothetical protein